MNFRTIILLFAIVGLSFVRSSSASQHMLAQTFCTYDCSKGQQYQSLMSIADLSDKCNTLVNELSNVTFYAEDVKSEHFSVSGDTLTVTTYSDVGCNGTKFNTYTYTNNKCALFVVKGMNGDETQSILYQWSNSPIDWPSKTECPANNPPAPTNSPTPSPAQPHHGDGKGGHGGHGGDASSIAASISICFMATIAAVLFA
eukprot:Nk52_evm37s485 gene=Nk52_evmTU37s485